MNALGLAALIVAGVVVVFGVFLWALDRHLTALSDAELEADRREAEHA